MKGIMSILLFIALICYSFSIPCRVIKRAREKCEKENKTAECSKKTPTSICHCKCK